MVAIPEALPGLLLALTLAVVVLIALVPLVQSAGDYLARRSVSEGSSEKWRL